MLTGSTVLTLPYLYSSLEWTNKHDHQLYHWKIQYPAVTMQVFIGVSDSSLSFTAAQLEGIILQKYLHCWLMLHKELKWQNKFKYVSPQKRPNSNPNSDPKHAVHNSISYGARCCICIQIQQKCAINYKMFQYYTKARDGLFQPGSHLPALNRIWG